MYTGTRLFLGFAVLLVTANALPDGYGVKGGGFRKPTGNAAASAHATAHAGSFGIAKSSATANADSSGRGGGTSNAYATAVASVDGGNIGKVIASEKATGNANGPGDSDDLSQSNDHGGDTEYKCVNHKDGIPGSSNRHPNAERVTLDTDKENSEKTADSQHSVGSEGGYGGNIEKPGTIGESHNAGPCALGDSKCYGNKPSVSNPYPTYEKNPDLPADSSIPAGIDGGYGGNGQKPGGIGGSHVASPCSSGDSKCYGNKPSVSNPYPTYEKNPDLPADSSIPAGIDGGYGGNGQKPGGIGGSHVASPCSSGDSKCYGNKPSVSNPYPTYEKNPDLPADSSISAEIDGGYGGNGQKPGGIGGSHVASPCSSGDSKCYGNKPSVSNPYPTYEKNPDLPADSSIPAGIDGGYGGNGQKPGGIGGIHVASPCSSGDSKCYGNKPSVSNPYPTYEKNPDLPADSSIPAGIDGGYGGNGQKPGGIGGIHVASPCSSGDSKCYGNKPSVSNPYPTYEKNPDLPADSSIPAGIDGGYGGNGQKPGGIGGSHVASPCSSGDSKCYGNKPSVSNPYPTYEKNPDLPADSSIPAGIDGGYGGNGQKPGGIGGSHVASPCSSGDSKCYGNKPSVSNPYPTYEKNPDLPADSSISAEIDGGYGGNGQKPGGIGGSHVASPCSSGDSKCYGNKPSVSNPYPTYEKNPDLPADSSIPAGIDGGYGGNGQKPGGIGGSHVASPCSSGDSKCYGNKPSVSNPYPTYEKNPDLPADSSISAEIDGGYGGNGQKPGGIGGSHVASPCSSGDSKCYGNKPSVSNPYPTYEKNPDLPADSSIPAGIDGGYGGNGQKPGGIGGSHVASPCSSGDSKCYGNKPSVSNPYPTYEKNPDLPADSSIPAGIDGGYGGNGQKSGGIGGSHVASPCSSGDSKCYANKPSVSSSYPNYEENPYLSADSQHSIEVDAGYGRKSPEPGTIGGSHAASPCTPGDSKCYANKPGVSNPYPTYEKNPDLPAGSSSRPGINSGYGGNGQKPGGIDGSHAASPCTPGSSKCYANKPTVLNPYPTYEKNPDTWESGSNYPASPDGSSGGRPTSGDHSGSHEGHSSSLGNKPGTSNPFLNGEIDLSGIKNPSNSGGLPGGKPNPLNPFLNPHNQLHPSTDSSHPITPSGNNGVSVGVAPQYPQGDSSGTTGYPEDKPKPSNPFLSHGHGKESTDTKYPGSSESEHGNNYPHAKTPSNILPGKDCQGSASCSTSKPLVPSENPFSKNHGPNGSGSEHESTQLLDKQPAHFNPFFVDGQSTKPLSNKPESHGTSDLNSQHVSSILNPQPGYNNEPPGERKPAIVEGCGSGISSAGCNNHRGPGDKDVQSWSTEGHEIDATTSNNKEYGVKGHWAGVKGGPRLQGHPIRFQGDSGLRESGHFGSEQKGTAESTANASASAQSSAHASSSSFSGAGQSNASAKSEAYSSSGSSNSWSSSSASASAFASSGSSHHDWTAPEIPQVTAQ